jgi:S-formylglutathione hydrolase FrmB
MQRRYDLDWLRVIAFGLLMLFHTGMMFSTWDWHVKNIETSDAFDFVMAFLHQWRMPLLFFISGSAVWFAMERYSTWQYFLERHKRLLLPLVFGMLVVIPPQVYHERLYHLQQFDSFWDFYRTVFTTGSYPEGNLSWHHLWYIPYIWTYSMILLPVCVWLRSSIGRPLLNRFLSWLEKPWALWLIPLPSALSDMILRPFWPYDANNLFADWGNFIHKLTFFGLGFALASGGRVYDLISAQRARFLAGGIATFCLLSVVRESAATHSGAVLAAYRLMNNVQIWMWLLAALGFGRRYLSFNHPVLRYATEAVYPFYILHQTIIIILAYHLAYVNRSIPVKFALVASSTFLIMWLLYVFAIRPWNLVRVAFGMKWLRPRQAGPVAGAGAPTEVAASRQSAAFATTRNGFAALCQHMPLRLGVPGFRGLYLLALPISLSLLTSCSSRQGKLLCADFEAPSLARNEFGIPAHQRLVIYLPPGYIQNERRFSVLYFLPNFNCCLWRYTGGSFQKFHLKDAMDRQLAKGAARDMIVVIPNTVDWLGGSFYRNSPLTGNWEDYIVNDVVDYIDSHFRSIPSASGRGLAGHGAGGTGALELALKHPDRFGSVYALSPALFDENGLRDIGILQDQQLRKWQTNLDQWEALNDADRRKSFRDYVQTRLNGPSGARFFEGLFISYGAAVSPDLGLRYPHIAFPAPGQASAKLIARYENGFGGWRDKISQYLAKAKTLKGITIEYGGEDEYLWIRHGAAYVSELMLSLGVPNALVVSEGGHESALGQRLETGLLPSMSKMLQNQP